MTDDLDPTLTGAAFELANAGYRPMSELDDKDEAEAIGSDSASLREAAERRSNADNDITIRKYVDQSGAPVAANEAVTLERAGRDYAGAVAADSFVAEARSAKELAARVDAMRAEALANDPDAAEFYGIEPKEAKADKTESEKSGFEKGGKEEDRGVVEPARLDPGLEKALQHPQVLQAIEQKVGEAEKTRQSYLNGLAAATQIAQVSFLSQFPELAATPPENLPGALDLLSRQDPAKYARVKALISSTEQMFAQQREESRRQTETARQNFQNYAGSEDARFETMLQGESKATQHAVMSEIFASARASGIEGAELTRLFHSEPLMRNAVFQRMMYDAGKYRLVMKSKDAVAAKPVPPVQRPGMARTPAEREQADLRSLNAKLSSSGDIKDAVALYNARKSGRR